MKAKSRARQALVVLGMHRSGTSAMARLLSFAGGRLPDRLMNPGPDNAPGFWEPWEMVALNDEMLTEVGSGWDDILGHTAAARLEAVADVFADRAQAMILENYHGADLPILKDPRASLAVPFWRARLKDIGLEPVHIIMVRHPAEVAASVAARNGADRHKTMSVWVAYMLAAERDTRGDRRAFIAYDALLTDWRSVLDRIAETRGSPWPVDVDSVAADSFVSASHRHQTVEEAAMPPLVEAVWTWMSEAARGESPASERLEPVTEQLNALNAAAGAALRELRRDLAGFPQQAQDLKDAREEIAALRTLCNRFHADADQAGHEVRELRTMVALFQDACETSTVRTVAADLPNDRLVLAAWDEVARCETRILRERARLRELREAMEASIERREAQAAHEMALRYAAEQTAHSVTQFGLAEAHRQLSAAGEAGLVLAAARDEALAALAQALTARDDLARRLAELERECVQASPAKAPG